MKGPLWTVVFLASADDFYIRLSMNINPRTASKDTRTGEMLSLLLLTKRWQGCQRGRAVEIKTFEVMCVNGEVGWN